MNTIINSLITALEIAPDAVCGARQERIAEWDKELWRSENWDRATKISAIRSAKNQGVITAEEEAFILGE